jgi:hypothetical protein
MKALFLISIFLAFKVDASIPSQEWVMFCGDSKTVVQHVKKEYGQRPTSKDLKEMKESRAPLLRLLIGGSRAMSDLLKEAGQSDHGVFGVMVPCGIMVNIKHEIIEKGCFDLDTGKVIKDKGGINACEKFLDSLPKE